VAAGWRAATLLGAGAEGRVVASFEASTYIGVAGTGVVGDLVWLGGPDAMLHPRAALLQTPPTPRAYPEGAVIRLPPAPLQVWQPAPLPHDAAAVAVLKRGAARLASMAPALGEPTGFGARLVGAPLAFPLSEAAARADALAAACASDDAERAGEAAGALLGCGPGLTPSGDDYVGGAFFARAVLTALGGGDAVEAAAWARAVVVVRDAAARSTHPISAALLGDLLAGHGWSCLHDLASSLARGEDTRANDAARRLTRLGHSSGWDLLAGFVAGAG